MPSSRKFWDATFQKSRSLTHIDPVTYTYRKNETECTFVDRIGDVEGLDILDVGCGAGKLSVFLAKKGARVTATDFSGTAVERTRELAAYNGVEDRVDAVQINALDLADLGRRFDLVVGKFILHHVEPFDDFIDVLWSVVKPGGRAIFMENNARNPVLMFARSTVTGRFGIPKHGDDEEHPLQPLEVQTLGNTFDVRLRFPEFVFFRTLNTYLFRHDDRFSPLMRFTKRLDVALWRWLPAVRKYSYLQVVEMTAPRPASVPVAVMEEA